MRASKAYIAGIGTTGVLVGSALLLLVVVSTLVAFQGWPGGLDDDIESLVVDKPERLPVEGPVRVALNAASAAAAVAQAPAPGSAAAGGAGVAAARGGADGGSTPSCPFHAWSATARAFATRTAKWIEAAPRLQTQNRESRAGCCPRHRCPPRSPGSPMGSATPHRA